LALRESLNADVDEELVLTGLSKLQDAGLLDGPLPALEGAVNSRRQFFGRAKTAAALALLVPAITTLAVPSPAAASSGIAGTIVIAIVITNSDRPT
jgi:hypothetical protein